MTHFEHQGVRMFPLNRADIISLYRSFSHNRKEDKGREEIYVHQNNAP